MHYVHGHLDPFLYHSAASLPMFLASAGMPPSSFSLNARSDHLDLLYHNFAIWRTGICNNKWISTFKLALSIYLDSGSLHQGYNTDFTHVLDWCVYQRIHKQNLEEEQQDLLAVIGI